MKVSDWIEPMTDKVRPLLEAAAKDYAEKNTGWPKRTEACDKAVVTRIPPLAGEVGPCRRGGGRSIRASPLRCVRETLVLQGD